MAALMRLDSYGIRLEFAETCRPDTCFRCWPQPVGYERRLYGASSTVLKPV